MKQTTICTLIRHSVALLSMWSTKNGETNSSNKKHIEINMFFLFPKAYSITHVAVPCFFLLAWFDQTIKQATISATWQGKIKIKCIRVATKRALKTWSKPTTRHFETPQVLSNYA